MVCKMNHCSPFNKPIATHIYSMTHLLVVGPGLVSTSPDSSSNNITTTEMKDCSNWIPITEDDSKITGIVELSPITVD